MSNINTNAEGDAPTGSQGRRHTQPTSIPPNPSLISDQDYEAITDPAMVDRAVESLVCASMANAWMVHASHPMAFIFDAINPARTFKRGMPFNNSLDFPDYRSNQRKTLTYIDAAPPGLMQFRPKAYIRTFYIKCTITIHDFMSWAVGTLRPFEIGSKQARSNRITYRKKHIPAPYDRILCQLIMEDRHGAVDRSHEAVRRQSYAQQVLDEFAKEFTSYEGEPIDFRSNVLSPILQRQLMGVSDAYLVSVRKAVGEGSDNPTIGQATRFYLEDDPTIPELIPNYRFNMVFIPQVRWHLGILMGVIQVGDHPGYKRVWDNQDYLMSAPPAECEPNLDGDQMPLFTPSMVTVIVDERLDLFFGPECGRVPLLVREIRERKETGEKAARKRAGSNGSSTSTSQTSDTAGNVEPTAKRRRRHKTRSSTSKEGSISHNSPKDAAHQEGPPHDANSDGGPNKPSDAGHVEITLGETAYRKDPEIADLFATVDPTTDEHRWLPENLKAGCVWDDDNYSCAFDVVFMAFYSMYGQSDSTWRNTWKAESPLWNVQLGSLFDALLAATNIKNPSAEQCSSWFSSCRNVFRNQVTQSEPVAFPHGRRFAPVSKLLHRILGGVEAEPFAYQDLICTTCGATKNDKRLSLSYIGCPPNLDRLRHSEDPTILPLQQLLTRFIETHQTEPAQIYQTCTDCSAPRRVRSLRLVESSWTWFEIQKNHQFILPSLEISYQPQITQRTHTLQGIIYLGNGHFVARMRKDLTMWWNYDDQWELGTPQLETITNEERLREFGDKHPVFLIYRRCDINN